MLTSGWIVGQDLEPRALTILPLKTTFFGAEYGSEINPALDVNFNLLWDQRINYYRSFLIGIGISQML